QAAGQAREHRLHHVVVIVAPRVAGDPTGSSGGIGRVRVRRVVLDAHREDRSRPWEGVANVAAARGLRGEIAHLARVTARDPLREEGALARRGGGGDAGAVAAGLAGEGPGPRSAGPR